MFTIEKLKAFLAIVISILVVSGCGISSTDNQSAANSETISWENKNIESERDNNSVFKEQVEDKERAKQAHFVTDQFGWYISRGKPDEVYVTTDKGLTWNNITPKAVKSIYQKQNQPGDHAYVHAMFLDSQVGWLFVFHPNHTITTFFTQDGGGNWKQSAAFSIDKGDGGMKVQFIDKDHGFIEVITAGHFPTAELLVTSDAGLHWQVQSELPFAGEFTFINPNTGWLAGGYLQPINKESKIYFYRTTDGGATWDNQEIPVPSPIHSSRDIFSTAPQFFNSKQGIMSVYTRDKNLSYIYHSDDSGETWNVVGHTHGSNPSFNDLLNGSISSLEKGNSVKWVTSDGGKTWHEAK